MTTTTSPLPGPADWYPDPDDPRMVRWFDGAAWSDKVTYLPVDPPTSLARSSLLDPANHERPSVGRTTSQGPTAVKFDLGDPVLCRPDEVVATQGKVWVEPLADGWLDVTGSGQLFVGRSGRQLHVVDLADGDRLAVAMDALVALDGRCAASPGRLALSAHGSSANRELEWAVLSGPAVVVVAADRPLVLNSSEDPTVAHPTAMVAWDPALHLAPAPVAPFVQVPPGGWLVLAPSW